MDINNQTSSKLVIKLPPSQNPKQEGVLNNLPNPVEKTHQQEKLNLAINLYKSGKQHLKNEDYKSAFKDFEKAADLGYEKAIERAAQLILSKSSIIGVPKAKAKEYLKILVEEKNNVEAMHAYAYYLSEEEKNVAEAKKWLRIAVAANSPEAMNNLAFMLLEEDAKNNANEVLQLFKDAIKLGSLPAIHNLAVQYNNGDIVEKNLKKAFSLFLEGAEKGEPKCMLEVIERYTQGVGVDKNVKESYRWCKKYCENDGDRWYEVAYFYTELGNIKEAVAAHTEAANLDVSDSINWLSNYYYSIKDYKNALIWNKAAAKLGSYDALCNLGHMYMSGLGTYKNYKKSIECYQKVIDEIDKQAEEDQTKECNHYIAAMQNMGICYLEGGNGIKQDKVKGRQLLIEIANKTVHAVHSLKNFFPDEDFSYLNASMR